MMYVTYQYKLLVYQLLPKNFIGKNSPVCDHSLLLTETSHRHHCTVFARSSNKKVLLLVLFSLKKCYIFLIYLMAKRNISVFCLQQVALYFKAIPNSIDIYKGIFLHVIHVCIIVPCSHNMFSGHHCVKSVQIQSFSWCVFSHIWTEYGDLLWKSPHLVKIRENTDQKKLHIRTFFAKWMSCC